MIADVINYNGSYRNFVARTLRQKKTEEILYFNYIKLIENQNRQE